jgi:hypothetical protein
MYQLPSHVQRLAVILSDPKLGHVAVESRERWRILLLLRGYYYSMLFVFALSFLLATLESPVAVCDTTVLHDPSPIFTRPYC